jgi:hypothetical protein
MFRAGGVSGIWAPASGYPTSSCPARQFMDGWAIGTATQGPVDIVEFAQHNDAFRREIITGEFSQVVAMTIAVAVAVGRPARRPANF